MSRFLVLILLCLLVARATAAPTLDVDVKESMQKAVQALRAGHLEEAEALTAKAVELAVASHTEAHEMSAFCRVQWAYALHQLRRYDEARQALGPALEFYGSATKLEDPRGAYDVLEVAGLLAEGQGNRQAAVELYLRSAEGGGGAESRRRYLAADNLYQLGRHSEALEQATRALELEPTARVQGDSYMVVGHCQRRLDDPEQAEAAYAKAVQIYRSERPGSVELSAALDQLGKMQLRLQQNGPAQETFTQLLRLMRERYGEQDPRTGDVLYHLGLAQFQNRDLEPALASLKQALVVLKGQRSYLSASCCGVQGRTLYALKRYPEAREAMEECLRQLPEHHGERSYWHRQLAQVLLAQAEVDAALLELDRAEAASDTLDNRVIVDLDRGQIALQGERPVLARRFLERALKNAPGQSQQALTAHRWLGGVELFCGNYEASKRHFEEVHRLLTQSLAGGATMSYETYMQLSESFFSMLELRRADQYNDAALKQALELLPPEHPRLAELYKRRGQLLTFMNDFEAAEPAFQEALRRTPLPLEQALLHTQLAGISSARAPQHWRQAADLYAQHLGPSHPKTLEALRGLAQAYSRLDREQEALEAIEGALEVAPGGRVRSRLLLGRAWIHLRMKRAQQAQADLEEIDVDSLHHYDRLEYQHFRGRVLLQLSAQQPELLREANLALQDSLQRYLDLRAIIPSEGMRRYLGEKAYSFFVVSVEAALASKDLGRALQMAEQALAQTLLELMKEAHSIDAAGVPKELLRELAGLETRLLQAQQQLDPQEEDDQVGQALQQHGELMEKRRRLVERLRREYPRFSDLRFPRASSAEEIQRGLLANEIAVLYLLGRERSHGFIVTRDTLDCFELPGRKTLERLVGRLQRSLSSPEGRPETAAETLGQYLLGPLAGRGFEDRSLIFVPSGRLLEIPFEVLPDFDRPGYLGRHHSVSYAPSLSLLHLTRDWLKLHPSAADGALLLGDPSFSTENSTPTTLATRDGYLSQDGNLRFIPLPFALHEVKTISSLLPRADLLVGEQASEQAYRESSLQKYRYLHFATHGILGRGYGLPPALVLSQTGNHEPYDGFLTMNEILAHPVAAEVVVLSACQTGRGKLEDAEGVIGLPRAFLYAGAGSVVVSLWKVDDRSTSALMTAFYRHLREHPPADALRRARRELMDQNLHPYFWAPFVLFGLPEGSR